MGIFHLLNVDTQISKSMQIFEHVTTILTNSTVTYLQIRAKIFSRKILPMLFIEMIL